MNPPALNFPEYAFSFRDEAGQKLVFDPLRKKYVSLTPEEWVRQHVIRFLSATKGYPPGLISVEGCITLYKTRKRYDIAVFDRNGKPLLIVECKAPEVAVNQAVADQAIRYNLAMDALFLFITNGLIHIILKKEGDRYTQVKTFPEYTDLTLPEKQ